LPGAAAEITHDPIRIEEAEHRRMVERLAEQVGAKLVPLTRRRGEELLRLGTPLGEHPFEAAGVLLRARGIGDLVAHDLPEALSAVVHAFAEAPVEAARAFGASGHPAAIGERLQVPADGRLRDLHHRADLGDRQLLPLEQQEDAAPGQVSQDGQVREDGRGGGS
jgi:hypothetical protein